MRPALFGVMVLLISSAARGAEAPKKPPDAVLDAVVQIGTGEGHGNQLCSGLVVAKNEWRHYFVVTDARSLRVDGKLRERYVVRFWRMTQKPGRSVTGVGTVEAEDTKSGLLILDVLPHDTQLPEPADLEQKAEMAEKAGLTVLGFPAKYTWKDAPNFEMSVLPGQFTSVEKKDWGAAGRLILSQKFNAGITGGPVVNDKGEVAGICLLDPDGKGLASVVSKGRINGLFAGSVQEVSLEQTATVGGQAEVRVKVRLMDPLRKMRAIRILIAPRAKVAGEPRPDEKGLWRPVAADMQEYPFRAEKRTIEGKIKLSGPCDEETVYLAQVKYAPTPNEILYTAPVEVKVKVSSPAAVKTPDKPDKPDKPPDGDWVGSRDANVEANARAGVPVESGRSRLGERKKADGAVMTTVDLPAKGLICRMIWSQDAKSVYLLEQTRCIVRKLSVPEFKEERFVMLDGAGMWLGQSACGLVVSERQAGCVYVLDETTLQPKRTIALTKEKRDGVPWSHIDPFAACRASKLAFVRPEPGNRGLVVLDLETGKAVNHLKGINWLELPDKPEIKRHKESRPSGAFEGPTLTPDGKYLLCADTGNLERFRIDDLKIVCEEIGPQVGSHRTFLPISPDSKYVAAGSGNAGKLAGHPVIRGVYIYKVGDLQQPVMGIDGTRLPVAFDKEAGQVYGHFEAENLIVFDAAGVKVKGYRFPAGSGETQEILVHPDGWKMLVRTGETLRWVELPRPAEPR